MDKEQIVKLIKDEIKKFYNDSLDNEIKKNLKNPNSNSRSEMIKTVKDSLETVIKVLWQKKSFWIGDIK